MAVHQRDTLALRGLVEALENLRENGENPELHMIELKEGEVLFKQGEKADSMYVLIAGVLGVRITHQDGSETILDRLAPGAILGEMAQMSGGERTATVYAINNAGVIKLSRQKLDEITRTADQASQILDDASAPRWQRLMIVKTLSHLFGNLETSALHSLQNHIEWQHHSNGSIVFKAGDPPDGLFIVVNGRLRVMVSNQDGVQSLHSEIGPGETVGEFGVLTGEVRSATIIAVRETDIIKISQDDFNLLINKYPQLLGNITKIIVERQQRAIKGIPRSSPVAQTIGLLPADPSIDLHKFSTQLSIALADNGSVMILDSHKFNELFDDSGRANNGSKNGGSIGINAWFGEMQTRNDFVIFTMDPQLTSWTQLCIGQADRILIVADPSSDPAPSEIENLLSELEIPIRTELVLWHPESTIMPVGTEAWLAGRHVQAHHHIRLNESGHMQRLARRLCNHAIGLVLSGGGARGFSHLGVYQAMKELKIPIDFVGGVSFGALMAGLIALQYAPDNLMNLADKFASPRKIFDYTLPFTSLMTSHKVTNICQELFGELMIEDLWCPFFCVSTNLSLATPTIHQSGYLWKAVRASLSIPGIFAPVITDDGVLVDGGVMDNFPVDWMNKLCESDRIIGVHASPHQDKVREWDYETEISGWKVLAYRINPFSKPVRSPSLISTVLRSQEINSAYQSKKAESFVDLLINIDVRQFGFLDFANYSDITRIGYETSINILKSWQEKYQIPH